MSYLVAHLKILSKYFINYINTGLETYRGPSGLRPLKRRGPDQSPGPEHVYLYIGGSKKVGLFWRYMSGFMI